MFAAFATTPFQSRSSTRLSPLLHCLPQLDTANLGGLHASKMPADVPQCVRTFWPVTKQLWILMKEKELNSTPSSNWLVWIPHPNKSLCSVIWRLPSDMGWDRGPCLKCGSIPRL